MAKKRKKPDYLTEKEFACLELYIKCGNKKQAGLGAGYSEKTAGVQATRLLNSQKGKDYLAQRMRAMDNEKIASTNEVLEYLTQVMRGEIDDINFKTGTAQTVGIHERTLAAQELAKRLLDIDVNTETHITIINDIPKPAAVQEDK